MPPDLVPQVFIALIPLLFLAVGQSVVVTGGGVDLAAPGMVMAATAAGSWVLATTSGSVAAAAATMLAAGLALGILNGLGVAWLPLPAWMVTLAGLGLLTGFSTPPLVHPAPAPAVAPPAMADVAGSLPAWTGLAVIVVLMVHLGLVKLVFGPWLHATGHHRESARLAGVPVVGVTAVAYGLSGLCAGLAAIFVAAHPTGNAPPSAWWLIDILGAVAVGQLLGNTGRASVPGVVLGTLILVGLGTLLARAGAPHGMIMALKCLLLLGILPLTTRAARHH